ncbi:tetratricopeptide repeat protein [Rhodospirillum sp. A1_3_36]|uniref:tetratricopeptide repeat protein n=1 Tax=Rhodospirillum sp. A1_3_36 TaxID=3391666 RepID=UPI0039A6F917
MPSPSRTPAATSLSTGARADLGWSLHLMDSGDREGALEACERALSQAPFHPDVILTAAVLNLDLGRVQEAEAQYLRLTDLRPDDPRGWQGLGRSRLFMGAPGPALTSLDHALTLGPPSPELLYDRAVALTQLGRLEEALTAIDSAIDAAPGSTGGPARFRARRARILERARRWEEAEREARQALALDPNDSQAALVLADTLICLNRGEEALSRARETLNTQLTQTELNRETLATALDQACRATRFLGRHGEASQLARTVLKRLPEMGEAARILALSLWWAGDFAAAPPVLDDLLARNPSDLEARWLRMLLALHPLYATAGERRAARKDHHAAALALAAHLDGTGPNPCRPTNPCQPTNAPGTDHRLAQSDPLAHGYPFHAPYHGPLDLDAQRAVGRYLSLVQERWAKLHPTPLGIRPDRGDRYAVVLASSFFRDHTICKLFKAWVTDIDRSRFHVTVLHFAEEVDGQSAEVARNADAFHHIPRGGLPALALLRTLAPDAILYPELGMSNDTLRLAAIRLAPVQAVSWGHPATTGLPSIDLFLSSDLMEPPTGHLAYTERLVRLPGLSIRYSPAFAVEDAVEARAAARHALGLEEDTPLFLSLQTHAKYHPNDDTLLGRIAARVPESRMAFIDARPPTPKGMLRARLEAAFRAEGADPNRQLLMLPPMPLEQYRRLNLAGDVFLDTPAWSGGNTTLEAIHCGLPIVTLPGQTMWSRHSAAILTSLEVPETIAGNRGAYVDIAVRLAQDRPWRETLVARASRGKTRLFTDPSPGLALSNALETAILRSRARTNKRP